MDYFEAIRAKCMLAVLKPDSDAWLRYVFRFYSERFHTPLHTVKSLPLEDVLVAFWETRYEDLEPVLLQEELVGITETEEDRQARSEKEEDDDAFLKAAEEEAAKQKRQDQLKVTPVRPARVAKEAEMPAPPLPDIAMKFDGNLLETWGDVDPTTPTPRTK